MSVEPGTVCPTCERRVNHPRKAASPQSRVKSFRIPADDETFDHDTAMAMAIVGLTTQHKYPAYNFHRFIVDCILRDEGQWVGAYVHEYEGVGA